MKPFPIFKLNEEITKSFKKIISLDISQGIRDGLDPMIHFTDEKGGPLTTIAKISEKTITLDENEPKRYVTISAAYAQTIRSKQKM